MIVSYWMHFKLPEWLPSLSMPLWQVECTSGPHQWGSVSSQTHHHSELCTPFEHLKEDNKKTWRIVLIRGHNKYQVLRVCSGIIVAIFLNATDMQTHKGIWPQRRTLVLPLWQLSLCTRSFHCFEACQNKMSGLLYL